MKFAEINKKVNEIVFGFACRFLTPGFSYLVYFEIFMFLFLNENSIHDDASKAKEPKI